MNTNLQNLNWQSEEKIYFSDNKNKILELWRELINTGYITQLQLENSYFELFISSWRILK